MEGEMVKKEL